MIFVIDPTISSKLIFKNLFDKPFKLRPNYFFLRIFLSFRRPPSNKIKYAYQNLNIFREVHRGILLLISSFGWILHILACKMRFRYCFSLSSSFLSFICFILMLFFRSERIEASSIVFFLGLSTFELLTWELFIEKMFYFFELDLCREFLWLQYRLLSIKWSSVFLVRSAKPFTPSQQDNLMIWKQL